MIVRKLLIFCGLILVDQVSKAWINVNYSYFLNQGFVWGIIRLNNGFILVSLLLGLICLYLGLRRNSSINNAFLIISAGSISNVIDRIIYGGVIDFINISFFPSFNIADLMIVYGIIQLIINWRFNEKTTNS